jgi:hypothetical protein
VLSPNQDLNSKSLKDLFARLDKLGKKRYHKLTSQDFESYRSYDHWRYMGGDGECGPTAESRAWVDNNSDNICPVCEKQFYRRGGKTIDHKLPRSQYPWLSMEFSNFWVICRHCNQEKGEKHWYEYEHFIFHKYRDIYCNVKNARPRNLLKNRQAEGQSH